MYLHIVCFNSQAKIAVWIISFFLAREQFVNPRETVLDND